MPELNAACRALKRTLDGIPSLQVCWAELPARPKAGKTDRFGIWVVPVERDNIAIPGGSLPGPSIGYPAFASISDIQLASTLQYGAIVIPDPTHVTIQSFGGNVFTTGRPGCVGASRPAGYSGEPPKSAVLGLLGWDETFSLGRWLARIRHECPNGTLATHPDQNGSMTAFLEAMELSGMEDWGVRFYRDREAFLAGMPNHTINILMTDSPSDRIQESSDLAVAANRPILPSSSPTFRHLHHWFPSTLPIPSLIESFPESARNLSDRWSIKTIGATWLAAIESAAQQYRGTP
mgnify:CR=1 FL=1